MSDTEASADEINRDMETEEESAVDTEAEEESGDHQEASPKLKKTPPAVSKKAKQVAKKAATSSKAASSGDSAGKKGKKTYEEMVLNAVKELKSRTGSSRAAILSYMKGAYNLGVEDKVVGFHVSASIKRGLAKGHLKHATEAGKGKNCFKLDEKGLELLKKTTANDKAKSKPKPKAKKVEKKKTPSKSGSSKPKAKSKKEVVPELKKTSSVTAKNKLKASASRRSSIATPVRVMKVNSKGGRKPAAEPKSKSGTKKSDRTVSVSAKKASQVKEASKKTSKEASKKASKPSDTKAKSTANGKTKKSVEATPPSKAKSASKKKATKK